MWWTECVFGLYAFFNFVILWVLVWAAAVLETPEYAVFYAVIRIVISVLFIVWICVCFARDRFYDPRIDCVSLLLLVLVFASWLLFIIAYAVSRADDPRIDANVLAPMFVCWIVDTVYVILYVVVEIAYVCGCLVYKHHHRPCRQTLAGRTLGSFLDEESVMAQAQAQAQTQLKIAIPATPIVGKAGGLGPPTTPSI